MAPLNWGLGHATRCIPIINALLDHNFEPIIASDGTALSLLIKEFPKLKCLELPSYNIRYAKNASFFKLKLLKDSPHLIKTIKKEKELVTALVHSENISGIISDNRFGVRHHSIPSVFITHQLRVLSGNTTWLSSKLHQNMMSRFDECWVPDYNGNTNLSGDLGHVHGLKISLKYIGPLSRFKSETLKPRYKLLVLLSGPEPQRSFLETRLFSELKSFKGQICFVKGKVETEQTMHQMENFSIYNFMTSAELEKTINASELILSRSGYTTIMDLAKLQKMAFFIPTPGQFEQEYLAEKLMTEGIAPSCSQKGFNLGKLDSVANFKGFKDLAFESDFKGLFDLFEREGKLASNT